MDGIRRHAKDQAGTLKFDPPLRDSFAAIHITPRSTTTTFGCLQLELREDEIRPFLRGGATPGVNINKPEAAYGLKVVCVPTDGRGGMFVAESTFGGILAELDTDPWVEHLIQTSAYGFHYSGPATNGATYFLGTSFLWAVWTTRPEKASYAIKCLFLVPRDTTKADAAFTHHRLRGLIECLKTCENDSRSWAYLPFALSLDVLRYRERSLLSCLDMIREVEAKTGHGSWGVTGLFTEDREHITNLTSRLGTALNTNGNTLKHLTIVESIWQYLEDHLPGRREDDADLGHQFLSAIGILRRQSSGAREQAQYMDLRIRSQSSVVSCTLFITTS